jgi:hypothetical protein
MVRFLLLALACVVAAQGGFVAFADQLGVPGFGDHLAALTIAWLMLPFLTGVEN